MILVTGDIHGSLDIAKLDDELNPVFSEMTKEDFVIICGDFGLVWDNSEEDLWWRDWLDKKPFTTLFVDGNHENFDLLYEFPVEEWHGGKVHRISDSIYHLMRGQLFEIQGHTFFTMGGAESHDKDLRIQGETIWKQELPCDEEYETAYNTLEECDFTVDCIITHCAPTRIQKRINNLLGVEEYSANRLTDFFDEILQNVDYKKWFCGHYHFGYRNKHYEGFEVLYDKIEKIEFKQ